MNLITITGNLGRDPESRQVGSKTVINASVAVSQGKEKDGTYKPSMWLDVSAWEDGYTLFAANELMAAKKGEKVVVSGRLSMREWTDKEGKPRQSWGITAQDVERVAPRAEQPQQEQRGGGNVRHTRAPQQTQRDEVPYEDDDRIPF